MKWLKKLASLFMPRPMQEITADMAKAYYEEMVNKQWAKAFNYTVNGQEFGQYSNEPQKLEELFRMQTSLNDRIGAKLENLGEEQAKYWVLNFSRAMQHELTELEDCYPWKWWANYQKTDIQNARVEVVDLWHFLICLTIAVGMSPEDLFQAYIKKNKVNLDRQNSGYKVKDPNDSRHI